MKTKFAKLLSITVCVVLILGMAACSSDDTTQNTQSTPSQQQEVGKNNIDLGGYNVEFKSSKNYSTWDEVKADSELFRADGSYKDNDTEVVYLHFKNHNAHPIVFKVNMLVAEGNSAETVIGVTDDIRASFSDSASAVKAVENKTHKLASGYIYTDSMAAESSKTVAVVLSVPVATTMNLKVDFNVVALDASGQNGSAMENGVYTVSANAYSAVTDAAAETVVSNSDKSMNMVFAANSENVGTVLSAVLKTETATATETKYNLTVKRDGNAFSGSAKVSLLVGYGFENVEVLVDGNKVDSTYDMYSGKAEFTVTKSCGITVKCSGAVNIQGVIVQGNSNQFKTFNAAIDHVSKTVTDTDEIVTFVVFGKVNYTVTTGQKIYFVGQNKSVKTINVVGGNSTAEIFITEDSGSVPSLPYAVDGVVINYNNMSFDSGNELQVDGEFSRHFDYRGEADISFKNCTFKKALATRGPKSSVVVENCNFDCPTYEDTFKGYCYYSVQKIGGGVITVDIVNNDFTGCWGGINLDWGEGDFVVKNNKFGGYNCSKPAIQLSHANNMLIENNEFSNITDENAFRFYKGYNGQKTHIINNTFNEVDYLFQSDEPMAMLDFKNFKFEGNTITGTTNLTLGHEANATADKVSPHGYTVDTSANTIK